MSRDRQEGPGRLGRLERLDGEQAVAPPGADGEATPTGVAADRGRVREALLRARKAAARLNVEEMRR